MPSAPQKGARRRKSARVPDNQLPLPLFEHGLQAAHQYPLVADQSKKIQGRRPAREAWAEWPYIEGNPPHAYTAMIFDIDDPDRWEFEVDGPTPNWQVRKDSQPTTYHVALALEKPVARHDAAYPEPLRFFREVYEGLAVHFGADCRYNGLMTKNPLHPPAGCSTQWFRAAPYPLAELRDWLPRVIPKPVIPTGVGRNQDLFDFCVKLAHQPKWARTILHQGPDGEWLERVRLLNIQQWADNPLPDSECRSIARSCARYSLRQFDEATFSEIQTARNTRRWHPGKPGYDYQGRAETVALMFDLGYSRKWLANHFGVAIITIDRDLAKIRKARRNSRT